MLSFILWCLFGYVVFCLCFLAYGVRKFEKDEKRREWIAREYEKNMRAKYLRKP